MNAEMKQNIRLLIQRACGSDIGEIRPEFFISATGMGPCVCEVDNTKEKFPHLKLVIVNQSGAVIDVGVLGIN